VSSLPADLKDLPDFLKPRLRIFLSVDIVNSTAFKQASHLSSDKKSEEDSAGPESPAQAWFSPIASFYRGMERRLAEEWDKHSAQAGEIGCSAGEQPMLWKASGDEVIYVKDLDSTFQALVVVLVWKAAVNLHRVDLKRDFPSLDLKASAWLAGFPVTNAEVILQRKPEDGSTDPDEGDALRANLRRLCKWHDNEGGRDAKFFRDFIGPSMDTGFRVATLAAPRKFALSIDLAYVVAYATKLIPEHKDCPPFKFPTFQYDGRVLLKGILGGAPYPYFWVDMMEDDPLLTQEDGLTGRKRLRSDEVREFCNNLFKLNKGQFPTPYIVGDVVEAASPFTEIPDSHLKKLKGFLNSYSNLDREAPSVSDETQEVSSSTHRNNGASRDVQKIEAFVNFVNMLIKPQPTGSGK
jgi:hypothetical protein